MEKDPKKDSTEVKQDAKMKLRETEQEVMIELKIKTNEFFKKFKEHNRKNRIQM